MVAKSKKVRRRYTQEEKQEIVRYVMKGDEPTIEVAKKFSVDYQTLLRWIKEWRDSPTDAFRGNGKKKAHEAEIDRLKRELARVSQERDFLKKVSTYFAGGPKQGTL